MLEDHLAVGWEYEAEVIFDAPVDQVRPWVSRAIGRLEPAAGSRTRLTGTTSNAYWYVGQLVPIPLSFRILRGPELTDAARNLGRQLLIAAGSLQPGTDAYAAPALRTV